MATTKLNILRDINGIPSYTLQQSTVTYTSLMSANTAQSVVAPTDAPGYIVVIGISNGADVLVSVNGAAVIPTSTFSTSTSAVNKAQTYVKSGGTVSVITPEDDVICGLEFYAIQ